MYGLRAVEGGGAQLNWRDRVGGMWGTSKTIFINSKKEMTLLVSLSVSLGSWVGLQGVCKLTRSACVILRGEANTPKPG